MPLWHGPIYHDITYGTVKTATECKSDFKFLTTDTPYLALTGELWGLYYENFEENWRRYNGTARYKLDQLNYICAVIYHHQAITSVRMP